MTALTPDRHDLERDATTLRLIPEAIARGMPVLAICRGIQELNVALGGTLHQKVHEVRGPAWTIGPGPARSRRSMRRGIWCSLSGQLARIVGSTKILVNSLHGQAIDMPAPGLVVEALAPDGTIEAVRVERAPRASRSACSGIRNGATPTTAPAWRCSARSARRAGRIGWQAAKAAYRSPGRRHREERRAAISRVVREGWEIYGDVRWTCNLPARRR